ncbi:MAG: TraB/GumN family protein [Candidatus ainarchaeum sp.]|nr:TraB/GumN family protein [Candidatus ainarchaeum sp.]
MIKRIKYEDKEIILVGTAHISKESMELVKETINLEQPDVVGVELDEQRIEQLLSGKKWQETNIIEIVKTGRTYLFLLNTVLSNVQKQLGDEVGIKPGSEMLVAIKVANENKKPIHLLDRNISITLKRAIKKMTLKEKIWIGVSLVGAMFGVGEKINLNISSIEDLKDQDLINKLMKELGKKMPSIKEVLVDERDAYIAQMIKISPGKKIVAVVGAGHLEGIEKIINEKKHVNLAKLNVIPKKNNYLGIIKYLIPLLFVILLIYLTATQGLNQTFNALIIWAIANMICASIGAILARAHIITIIVAGLAAPLTSLHPAIAAGWVAAIVEGKFYPPRVMDFEEMSQIKGISGYYKNRVTHILIVTAFVNLGSTIGTFVAVPFLLGLI